MTSRFPTDAEIASFPKPNYVDPETKTVQVLSILVPMIVLVVVFISCRFWSRTVIVRAIGLDDFLMLVAALTSVANSIMVCIATRPEIQNGYHLWDFKPEHILGAIKAAQVGMATQLLFTITCSFTKLAILVTYLRIFPSRTNKWFCHVMAIYTTAWLLGAFFLTLFQCSPIETYWEVFKYLYSAKCLNLKAVYYAQGSLNTLSDFLIFLWPILHLYAVKITLRQRVTLITMFSLGVIICIAGIARLYYTHVSLTRFDVFWNAANSYCVMAVETSFGIACGCLPGCKPLLSRLFPNIFGTCSSPSNTRTTNPPTSMQGSSYPLSGLSHDVIVEERGYTVEYSDAKGPTPSIPVAVHSPARTRHTSFSRRFSHQSAVTRGHEPRLDDSNSFDSEDVFILQGVGTHESNMTAEKRDWVP